MGADIYMDIYNASVNREHAPALHAGGGGRGVQLIYR